jgi:hypothetical protein
LNIDPKIPRLAGSLNDLIRQGPLPQSGLAVGESSKRGDIGIEVSYPLAAGGGLIDSLGDGLTEDRAVTLSPFGNSGLLPSFSPKYILP